MASNPDRLTPGGFAFLCLFSVVCGLAAWFFMNGWNW